MAALAWVMMGLAIWHFAIFIPDRFWGGIVGSLLCAVVGAVIIGLIFSGFSDHGDQRRRSYSWRVARLGCGLRNWRAAWQSGLAPLSRTFRRPFGLLSSSGTCPD